jgi:hypothetical protein
MPPEEAGYTYAVEPTAIDRLLANEEESIYRHSHGNYLLRPSAPSGLSYPVSPGDIPQSACDRLFRIVKN